MLHVPSSEFRPCPSRITMRRGKGRHLQDCSQTQLNRAALYWRQLQRPGSTKADHTRLSRPLATSSLTRASRSAAVSQRALDPSGRRSIHITSSTASATACRWLMTATSLSPAGLGLQAMEIKGRMPQQHPDCQQSAGAALAFRHYWRVFLIGNSVLYCQSCPVRIQPRMSAARRTMPLATMHGGCYGA